MTVEAAGSGVMGEEGDEFPVGMRVLAVDDDPTCLKVLDAMLRQCKYHVTTTNQAIKALKMLRENKDKFDLIITDVHMPDMDGFKLLELVGLEMDLPVIMLSANGDTKVVMKGIAHGACDYLLKPVRMEELKNIWQHVVRKKKYAPKEHNNSDNGTFVVGHGSNTSGSSEFKLNRKRKDQNEEEEDDEENSNENENTSNQKKARVVWSVELHRKFMAAVNHLGISKAVPKRILDLMNVEGLTRENVASHLQKYRLYLKKVASQEANLVAALGVRDSYLPLAALDNFGDFHSFTSPSQLPALPSFQQNGGLSRKDPTALGHNSISHGSAQVGRIHNACNRISDLSKFQHVTGSQHGNLLQSMPTLGMDKLQQDKRMIQEANNCFSGSFPAGGLGTGCSNNPISTAANSPLTLQQIHQTSIGLPSICAGPFEMNVGVSSNVPDPVRFSGTWQCVIPSTGTASGLPMNSSVSSSVSQMNCNPLNFCSSSTSVPAVGNAMLMLKGTNEDSEYLNFRSVVNTQRQWREANQDLTYEPNIVFTSSLSPSLTGQSIIDPTFHSQRVNNGMCSKMVFTNMNGQANHSTPFLPQQCKIDKSAVDGQLKNKNTYYLENSTLQGGLSSNGYNFDELMNMIKSERDDGAS